ncbi:MAG TPA: hypothetical protein VNC78_07835 [Actinomycetota bacterium]|nr:hypothetical protein [Actinomycetota bacterium]
MRARSIVIAAAALILGSSVFPGAVSARPQDHRERVVVAEYLAHGMRTTHWDEQLKMLPEAPALVFDPKPRERFVRFNFTDTIGESIYAWLHQKGAGGRPALDTAYCGTEGVFKLTSDAPIEVRLYSGLCENHLIGLSTRGTVTATFTTGSWALTDSDHQH